MNTPNVKKCYPFIKLLVGPNTFWRGFGFWEKSNIYLAFQICSRPVRIYSFKRILRKKIPGCIWLV